jgi:hypothetical protein
MIIVRALDNSTHPGNYNIRITLSDTNNNVVDSYISLQVNPLPPVNKGPPYFLPYTLTSSLTYYTGIVSFYPLPIARDPDDDEISYIVNIPPSKSSFITFNDQVFTFKPQD